MYMDLVKRKSNEKGNKIKRYLEKEVKVEKVTGVTKGKKGVTRVTRGNKRLKG